MFLFKHLSDKGFHCEQPWSGANWSGVELDINFNEEVFLGYLDWAPGKEWSLWIFSVREYNAKSKHVPYDESDIVEWRAVCEAVDEVLRSDSQITGIRWFSFDEWDKERKQQSISR